MRRSIAATVITLSGKMASHSLNGWFEVIIMLPLVMYEFKKNIERDFMIWENKAYHERPQLNKANGDIFRFRHYCKQFYPDRSEVHKGTELNSVPASSDHR